MSSNCQFVCLLHLQTSRLKNPNPIFLSKHAGLGVPDASHSGAQRFRASNQEQAPLVNVFEKGWRRKYVSWRQWYQREHWKLGHVATTCTCPDCHLCFASTNLFGTFDFPCCWHSFLQTTSTSKTVCTLRWSPGTTRQAAIQVPSTFVCCHCPFFPSLEPTVSVHVIPTLSLGDPGDVWKEKECQTPLWDTVVCPRGYNVLEGNYFGTTPPLQVQTFSHSTTAQRKKAYFFTIWILRTKRLMPWTILCW